MRLRLALLLAALLAAAPAAQAQQAEPAAGPAPADAPLPLAPEIRTGTLDNGLTYFIRPNAEPQNRAELRLVVNAGSVLEDSTQLGLAHFLEHMLFNGTERFPEQELVDFLERTGMRFGPDVNAYTSFDETVYMLQIPTDSTEIVETAFDVLEDWASRATLSDEEIDKERGVVIEEWRAREQNASGRIREQLLPALLGDARYADRLPIGDPAIIETADPETVRRFYRDWYRPDLMAVVVVGDLDPDRAEALVREHFADLAPRQDAPVRGTFEVPGHAEPRFAVITDPEYPYASVQVQYKRDALEEGTTAGYRAGLVARLFNEMLNARFSEIARRPDAPFLGAGVSRGGLVRGVETYGLGAQVQEDSVLTGLDALLTEAARIRAAGFTPTELERAKQEVLRAFERAYNERENLPSGALAGELVAHFLENEPAPGIAYEYELAGQLLPTIGVEDVNRLGGELLSETNRVVSVILPEKETLAPPTEAALAAVFAAVDDKEIAAYVDDVSDAPLLEAPAAPAAVTDRTEFADLGVTVLTLENGVRVVMKPTDFKQDEVRFRATSPGGTSLVPTDDLLEAQVATALVAQSGVGGFDRTQLTKKLAGTVASVSPFIGELEEGLQGAASPEDLETLFQLIHLYVTDPRTDEATFTALQNQYRAFFENRSADPSAVFSDSVTTTLYGDHPRRRPPTVEDLAGLRFEDAVRVYEDRFADAGDFTFVFVGNFDVARLTELAQTYLGTLPTTGRDETWRDVAPDVRSGALATEVRKGIAEQSRVLMRYHGPFTYTPEARYHLSSMIDVLRIRLREDLREDRGGVYGVSVGTSTSEDPDPEYVVTISFTTDPERVDELVAAVEAQIARLKAEGPTEDELEKVREQQRRGRETDLRENAFWLSTLGFYFGESGDDEDPRDLLAFDERVDALTAEDVQEAARRYLDGDDTLRAVLLPESAE